MDFKDFSTLARQKMLSGQTEAFDVQIRYIYEPSFGNPFCLNVGWNANEGQWEKQEWDRGLDLPKFGVIESLKHIGQTVEPTIINTEGPISRDRITGLRDRISRLHLPVLTEKHRWIMVDGETHTLDIGNINWRVSYKWAHLPEEWQALEEIIEDMRSLSHSDD